jgi:hypothetical protein
MSIEEKVAFDLDDLPMDVFELADLDLEVESLTAGHGMESMGASCRIGGSGDGKSSCSTSS